MLFETSYITVQQYLNNDYDKNKQLTITDNLKDNWELIEPTRQRPMTVSEYIQAYKLYDNFIFSYNWYNKTLEQVYNDIKHRTDCNIRNYINEPYGCYLDVEITSSSDIFKDVEYILITFSSDDKTSLVRLSDDINIAILNLDYEYEYCNKNDKNVTVGPN